MIFILGWKELEPPKHKSVKSLISLLQKLALIMADMTISNSYQLSNQEALLSTATAAKVAKNSRNHFPDLTLLRTMCTFMVYFMVFSGSKRQISPSCKLLSRANSAHPMRSLLDSPWSFRTSRITSQLLPWHWRINAPLLNGRHTSGYFLEKTWLQRETCFSISGLESKCSIGPRTKRERERET